MNTLEHMQTVFNGRRVLVTGSTGFKGSWLCLWLKHMGAEVLGIGLEPPSEPSMHQALRLREVVRHELPESERVCPHDGAVLREIGVEASEQLDIIPQQVRVIRHERVKYACPCCDGTLRLAAKPEQVIPKGLFSIVTSSRSADIGKEFCENPLIRKLTFTGSTEVGRILLRQAADQVLKCSMELGGNAPFIVFDDADLDAAVEGAMASKFRNNGQTCVCANRLYVQDGVYDAFVEKLAAEVGKLQIGNGFSKGVSVGPMIEPAALVKVQAHIDDAVAKGGRVVTGGQALEGQFYAPTVIANATQDMRCAREETFGPLAPVFRFRTEAEAIAAANATEFGLASYFFSRDIGRITRVSEALEYGMVGVNTGLISSEQIPFGGVKQSGLGREGSHHGMDEYLEMKLVCIGDIRPATDA